MINADRLSELAHFTATKVGTEGGFYISKDHERQEVKKDFLNRNETGQGQGQMMKESVISITTAL